MRDLGTFTTTVLALASSIALVGSFSAVSLAQGTDETGAPAVRVEVKPAAPPQKPMQEERANPPAFDPSITSTGFTIRNQEVLR